MTTRNSTIELLRKQQVELSEHFDLLAEKNFEEIQAGKITEDNKDFKEEIQIIGKTYRWIGDQIETLRKGSK